MPTRLRHPLPASVLAAAGAAALPGVLQALLIPGLPAAALWREKLALVLLGNTAAAAAFILLQALAARLGARRPQPGRAALAGLALGLGPLAGQFFDARNLGAALGLAGAVLALCAPAFRVRFAVLLGAADLLALPLLWFLPALPWRGTPRPPLPPAAAAAAARGPDVVLISIDTLRADALEDLTGRLPNFERLRSRGAAAAYGLAPSPSTFPSHLTMLSGVGVLGHGALSNEFRVPAHLRFLAQRFAAAGWRTAGVVSNGMLRGWAGFDRGFEAYDDSGVAWSGHLVALRRRIDRTTWLGWLVPHGSTEALLDAVDLLALRCEGGLAQVEGARTLRSALDYLQALQKGVQPFFLFLHFMDPHDPYEPPETFAGRVAPRASMPERVRAIGLGSPQLSWAVARALKEGAPAAEEEAAYLHKAYLEEVLFVDACLGKILDALEAGGRETVVLLTADHGEQFGEHGLMLHSNSLYEELLRVPFFVAGAGIEPGSLLPVVPQLEDVAPTLLALAGLPAEGFEGRNLAAAPAPRRQVAVLNLELSLRVGPWKLHAAFPSPGGAGDTEPRGLFQVAEDPGERRDLLSDEPERAAAMAARAELELARARFQEHRALPEEDRRILEELGYLGTPAEDGTDGGP